MQKTLWPKLLILLAVMGLFQLGACSKEEEVAAPTEKKLVIPTSDRDEEWREFVRSVAASKFVRGKTTGGKVYMRFLGTTESIEGHTRDAISQFTRPMARGSMMVYGSYNSRNMAKILIDSFSADGVTGNLAGSTMVFVGRREDEPKVREASVKSGVTFEFYPVD